MAEKLQKFFLASNSCEGFISHFGDSFSAKDVWSAFIIKGGPGTGKSSFMRHFAAHAREKGLEVILCPCTSDPGSLDGVIVPAKKIVILDGTAPHTLEPVWPGVCEEIVNLGEFWNADIIKKNSEKIFEVSKQKSVFHRKASCYLRAAGQVITDSLHIAERCTDIDRCTAFAESTVKKLIPDKNSDNGKEWIRFIQGVTPLGIVSYTDSITDYYENRVVISDPYGSVGNIFMRVVREYALSKGYEIITVKNAFLPSSMIDHVLIPKLSLAFVTENKLLSFGGNERRIHARRFIEASQIHSYRQRLLFNRRITKELIMAASETLVAAKDAHSKLEKYYISAMDWSAATEFAERFVKEKL